MYRSPVWVNSWDCTSSAWKRARNTPVSVSFKTPWRAFRSTRSVSWTPSMYWEAAWSKQFPSPIDTHRRGRHKHMILVLRVVDFVHRTQTFKIEHAQHTQQTIAMCTHTSETKVWGFPSRRVSCCSIWCLHYYMILTCLKVRTHCRQSSAFTKLALNKWPLIYLNVFQIHTFSFY